MYRALYRKWRPRKFADVVGQEAIVTALQNQIAAGRIGHAYLFTGTRGTGKTTCAKIFAKAVNCLDTTSPDPCGECAVCKGIDEGTILDVSEIDAASNNSVDDIRDLRDETAYLPAVCKYKVYIIDEVHMLSTAAFNALLKTLEEPVPGTIFLLMTESPSLLLPTIVSRCRELKLHPWDDRTVLSVLEKHGVTGQRAQEALHVSGGSIGKALAVAGDEQYWQRRSEVMRDFFALERRSDILRISSTWKDRKDDAEELLDDVEDMLRTLLLCHLGQRSESAVTPYPAAWQRFSREGELSAMMRLLDAVAQARQMRANQVTWQAVVERLLLSLMEEKSKWST